MTRKRSTQQQAQYFADKSVRLAFIRKVYLILMVQLLITGLIMMGIVLYEPIAKYFQSNRWWLLIAFVILLVCLVSLSCCEGARRKVPFNYILLFIFTAVEGFFLGVVSSTYRTNEVLLAVGMCAVLCLALTIFAFQTKIDFTMLGGFLLALTVILVIFGLILIFFPRSHVLRLIYACFGALLFSVYLIYDTQLMIGGHHKYSISPDEYIFAALVIYIDIINIFLYILMILGGSSRSVTRATRRVNQQPGELQTCPA